VLGAKSKKTGYIEGNGYYITWAFGHLIELEDPEFYDSALKRWSLNTLPFLPNPFKLRIAKRKGVSAQFKIIKSLFKKSSSIICATDAGREGELIFRYIQEKARVTKMPSQRLWINSLTREAIREGFNNLKPLSDYDALAAAAKCRSEADWIIGLNATRAYTVKYSHGNGVFSVGRVQTPVLAMIVNRDREIANFISSPFWELKTAYRNTLFTHSKKRFTEIGSAQEVFTKVNSHELEIVDVSSKEQKSPPPTLFDLTELQRTMNRVSGMSAQDTLGVAQTLYESKLITYPRTDSRYLSDDIFPTCKGIISKLQGTFPSECAGIASITKSKRFFNSAKVNDHHAIIPTGHSSASLSGKSKLIYDVIVKRFLAIFYPTAVSLKTEVLADVVGEHFKAQGIQEIHPGWKVLYPKSKKSDDEQTLPSFIVGERGAHTPQITESKTKPPKYFTEATLLSAMEYAGKEIDDEELKDALKEKGLGTPATRASIIETLVRRDYIKKDKKLLRALSKGDQLITLLAGQNTLISPELTGFWEQQLHRISRGEYDAARFMEAVRKYASVIVGEVTGGVSPLGLGACPQCGSPIIKGSKGGYGCSAWKTGCQFRFFGEQFGVKLTEDHVSQLLSRGRLSRPRNLTRENGETESGYLTINKYAQFFILTREMKEEGESVGSCPLCRKPVMEQYKSYSCSACDFVIWKRTAGLNVSTNLASVLLAKGRTIPLKGFRSKKGKRFTASLVIKDGKVELEF
jgi:DNA topoisomerase-3